MLSAECEHYRLAGRASDELKQVHVPDQFEVDFVRVYDAVK